MGWVGRSLRRLRADNCRTRRIGPRPERHHAPPLAETESEELTTLIPFCTNCHGVLTLNRGLHRRQLRARASAPVINVTERLRLPSSIRKDPEVREAVQQSLDEHGMR